MSHISCSVSIEHSLRLDRSPSDVLDLKALLLLRHRYEQSLGSVYAHCAAADTKKHGFSQADAIKRAVADAQQLGWMFHAALAHHYAKLQQQQPHQHQHQVQEQTEQDTLQQCPANKASTNTVAAGMADATAKAHVGIKSTPFFTRSLQQIAATARERSELQMLPADPTARTSLPAHADSNSIVYRPITRDELATLRHLNMVTLPMSVWRSYDQQYYTALLRAQDHLTQFACDNGKMVGAICARVEHPGAQYNNARLHILTVSVLHKFRRRGIAAALLRGVILACEQRWEHRHVREAYLSVQASNDGARALYTHCGFRVAAAHADYYKDATSIHDGGSACIVMTRPIYRGALHRRRMRARLSCSRNEA